MDTQKETTRPKARKVSNCLFLEIKCISTIPAIGYLWVGMPLGWAAEPGLLQVSTTACEAEGLQPLRNIYPLMNPMLELDQQAAIVLAGHGFNRRLMRLIEGAKTRLKVLALEPCAADPDLLKVGDFRFG